MAGCQTETTAGYVLSVACVRQSDGECGAVLAETPGPGLTVGINCRRDVEAELHLVAELAQDEHAQAIAQVAGVVSTEPGRAQEAGVSVHHCNSTKGWNQHSSKDLPQNFGRGRSRCCNPMKTLETIGLHDMPDPSQRELRRRRQCSVAKPL